MDSFLDEMQMWVMTPRGYFDPGVYERMRRSNEVHSKLAELKKWQNEVYACQARLESNWTSFNFEQYGTANWNLKLVKSDLDDLVKDTWEQIVAWEEAKDLIY